MYLWKTLVKKDHFTFKATALVGQDNGKRHKITPLAGTFFLKCHTSVATRTTAHFWIMFYGFFLLNMFNIGWKEYILVATFTRNSYLRTSRWYYIRPFLYTSTCIKHSHSFHSSMLLNKKPCKSRRQINNHIRWERKDDMQVI